MDNILLQNRLKMPVITGVPAAGPVPPKTERTSETASFKQLLEQQLAGRELSFSKHAASRVQERGIELTDSSLARLDEGVRIAKEKGLDGALILVDKTAFIVSAKKGTVITTLGGDDLKGNCITNIEGTVII